ncbi:MAG: hypothetical protein ACRES9_00900 [Gammaproteobacteria bacterium]
MKGLSVDIARELLRVRKEGFRGIALLCDPPTGALAIFSVNTGGCCCLGTAPIVGSAPAFGITQLPDLSIPESATPTEAFQAVGAELRRMKKRLLN